MVTSTQREGQGLRFPVVIGIGAFRMLSTAPAAFLLFAAFSQVLYLSSGYLGPLGQVVEKVGFVGVIVSLVLVISPLVLVFAGSKLVRTLMRAVRWRACDLRITAEGVELLGGTSGGFAAKWSELRKDGPVTYDYRGLRVCCASGMVLTIPVPENREERTSLEELGATLCAYAGAFVGGAAGVDVPVQREPPGIIRCVECGAAVPPRDDVMAVCGYCQHQTAMPKDLREKIRSLSDMAQQRERDNRTVGMLLHQRSAAFANTVAFTGGGLCVLGTALTLFLTAVVAVVGLDSVTTGWLGLGLFEIGAVLVLLALVRRSLAHRRALRVLTLGFCAVAPRREGEPAICRNCAGPLPQMPKLDRIHETGGGASCIPCAYCGSVSVVALDLRVMARVVSPHCSPDKDPAAVLSEVRRQRRRAGLIIAVGFVLMVAGLITWL